MADINNPVAYSPEIKKRISDFLSRADLKSTDWGEDDIQDIRKLIRNYYRNLTKKCIYCRNEISIRSVKNCHVEHIIPKSKYLGFMFEPKNLCVICSDCNEIKNNKEATGTLEEVVKGRKTIKLYPRSSDRFLVVHPHFDNYEEHIRKIGDIYIDLSTKGSYTIHICELNRKLHKDGLESMALTRSQLFDLFNEIMTCNNYTREFILMNKLKEYIIRAS
ncbi:HNH endonuclease [Chryseobacterium scophthalmum]|uniref:HNH endonuclease n=1 Tax=Chryseobacterium scophthalmum TaxID=59733 RepID=UPI000C9DF633|nr:HNH endonuclease [Chryseobacterium scophthalmum]